MVKKRKLKTKTLVDRTENPVFTLCMGHVTTKVFNRAFRAEGWAPGDWISKDMLRHEYWRPMKNGWRKSRRINPEAKKVTVMSW